MKNMIKYFFILLLFFVISYTKTVIDDFSNDNREIFSVYRVIPKSKEDLEVLRQLESNNSINGFDFWVEPRSLNHFCDIMTRPTNKMDLILTLQNYNISHRLMIKDVQELIIRNEKEKRAGNKGSKKYSDRKIKIDFNKNSDSLFSRRFDDDVGGRVQGKKALEEIGELSAKYPFGEYTSYSAMIKYMRTVEFYYPHLVRLIRIGKSHEDRPLEGLKIGIEREDKIKKRAFWIDGNIHAREWASSHTALFIINQLVYGYGKDNFITHFLKYFDVYIMPVLNPDGYEYSRSSTHPEVRLWRKNRSPRKCAPGYWGGIKCCMGTDLNRNFDFYWSETGSSDNPCSNQYHGSGPVSEPEAKAVNDFLTSDEMIDRLDGFITLHTYAQLWIHPYSHEYENYPNDVRDISRVALKAINRLRAIYGTDYNYGTGADLLSPASGGSDDWAKSALQVKYVYLIELRPEMELSGGFILDKDELIPTGVETFEAIKVVMEACLAKNKFPTKSDNLVLEDIKTRENVFGAFFRKDSNIGLFSNINTHQTTPSPLEMEKIIVPLTKVTTLKSTISTTLPPLTTTSNTSTNKIKMTATSSSKLLLSDIKKDTTTIKEFLTTTSTKIPIINKDNMILSNKLFRKQLLRLQAEAKLKEVTSPNVIYQSSDLEVLPIEEYEEIELPEEIIKTSPIRIPSQVITKTKLLPIQPIYHNHNFDKKTQVCEDNQRSCKLWIEARPSVCRDQKRFMEIQCPLSCSFCTK
uniref:Peptidase_M14 domain-containing protein n=1 Tax=Parastrongyloides trichosuri TaxID=131310 RepID=A0A0N4ZVK1_PARTI